MPSKQTVLVWFAVQAFALTASARPRARDTAPQKVPTGAEEESRGIRVTVTPGDTLSELAQRHGYSVADLVEWNAGLDPNRIRVGQVLWLGDARRMRQHPVAPGETLTSIARFHRVPLSEILRTNPGLDPQRIRVGQRLRVFSQRPRSPSESVGLPFSGSLAQAARLREHPGYLIRDDARAWGTDEAVQQLRDAFEHLHQLRPRGPRVEVHDLSAREGGALTDHSSHQSGRDADVAYIGRDCPGRGCAFRRIRPSELDTRRQWELLHYWLAREQVEAVFVDYSLQKVLYEEAVRQGANRNQLGVWFQYPRGKNHPGGTVRHHPNHADHVHVRFACHRSDGECQPVRVVAERARLERAAR